MGEKNLRVYENAPFSFDSFKAETRIDALSTTPNEKQQIKFKVSKKINEPITFSYLYGTGLVLKNSHKSRNILGEFLRIKENDLLGFVDFFNEYGFLYPIKEDRFTDVDFTQIINLSKRLNCLLELYNLINDINSIDIRKIMELSLYLFFEGSWNFEMEGCNKSSKKYNLAELISFTAFDSVKEKDYSQELINTGSFVVHDSIFGNNKVDNDVYKKIIEGYDSANGHDNFRFQALTYLYANFFPDNKTDRKTIELLYHFYNRVGIPLDIECNGVTYYQRYQRSEFGERLTDYIIDFAKYIIKSEINEHIKDVHPVYNGDSMQPNWEISSLLSAMYFSIFYLNSKTEVLRRCAYCGRYFLVKKSTSVKKYCDKFCRNNAQQAVHRAKLKENR